MRLGKNQQAIIAELKRTQGRWYPGCGWYWGCRSETERLMKSLEKRELVRRVELEPTRWGPRIEWRLTGKGWEV